MSKIKQPVNYADILKLAEDYSNKLEEVKKNQPYHLNIIEELHINENAHSRILAKLLQYNEDGRYVFLESFLKSIRNIKPQFPEFDNKSEPEITQEKNRIDVLVLTKGFAIIIENKVCEAKDQYKQLHRYIDKVKKIQKEKNKNYIDNDIYIIYLTKYNQSPNDTTWGSSEEREEYAERFCNLSYMDDVLGWLDSAKQDLKEEECELKSALDQYINYLKILSMENMKPLDKNIKVLFENKYGNDFSKLSKGVKHIQILLDGSIRYKREIVLDYLKKNEIVDTSVGLTIDGSNVNKPLMQDVIIGKKEYCLSIQLDDDLGKIYCSLEIKKDGKKKQFLPDGRDKKFVTIYQQFSEDGEEHFGKLDNEIYSEWELSDSSSIDNALKRFKSVLGNPACKICL